MFLSGEGLSSGTISPPASGLGSRSASTNSMLRDSPTPGQQSSSQPSFREVAVTGGE